MQQNLNFIWFSFQNHEMSFFSFKILSGTTTSSEWYSIFETDETWHLQKEEFQEESQVNIKQVYFIVCVYEKNIDNLQKSYSYVGFSKIIIP